MKINRLSNNLCLPRMIIQRQGQQRGLGGVSGGEGGGVATVGEVAEGGGRENALCVGEMCRRLSS